jgi:hypothetical protein
MDPGWCYLCRIDLSGVEPRAAWGLDAMDDDALTAGNTDPMTRSQAAYLRFLCEEFGYEFDQGLSAGDAAVVIESFMNEQPSDSQGRTLAWLSEHAGVPVETGLTYGQARTKIRRLVALRGLKSA